MCSLIPDRFIRLFAIGVITLFIIYASRSVQKNAVSVFANFQSIDNNLKVKNSPIMNRPLPSVHILTTYIQSDCIENDGQKAISNCSWLVDYDLQSAIILRAHKLSRDGFIEQASDIYDFLIANDLANASVYNAMGLIIAEDKNAIGQAEEYLRLAAMSDSDYRYKVDLGWFYYEQGEWRKAIDYLRMALSSTNAASSESAFIWRRLGLAQRQKGDYTAAAESFLYAYTLSDNPAPDTPWLLTSSLLATGKFEETLPIVFEELSNRPGCPEWTIQLARIYAQTCMLKEYDELMEGNIGSIGSQQSCIGYLDIEKMKASLQTYEELRHSCDGIE